MTAPDNSPEQFHGLWSLIEWRIEYEDGGTTLPFGEAPTGHLSYLPDVVMVTMARAGHPPIAPALSPMSDEGLSALSPQNNFYYEADWSLSADCVTHSVKRSLNPEMVGTLQVRKVSFDGPDQLTLTTFEPMKNGQKRQHFLKWVKAQ